MSVSTWQSLLEIARVPNGRESHGHLEKSEDGGSQSTPSPCIESACTTTAALTLANPGQSPEPAPSSDEPESKRFAQPEPALPPEVTWAWARAARAASTTSGLRAAALLADLREQRSMFQGLRAGEVQSAARAAHSIADILAGDVAPGRARAAFVKAVAGDTLSDPRAGELVLHASLHHELVSLVQAVLDASPDFGDGKVEELADWLNAFSLDPGVVDAGVERATELLSDLDSSFTSISNANALMACLHQAEDDSI